MPTILAPTMRIRGRVSGAVLLLGMATVAYGEAHSGLQTILLPIYAPVPLAGANGSRWATDVFAYNASSAGVALRPCGLPPEAARCPPEVFLLRPHITEHNPPLGFGSAGQNGRLIYLTTADAPFVTFALVATELTRQVQTRLPVAFATAGLPLRNHVSLSPACIAMLKARS